MKITQISIFIENTSGRLYDVCSLLGQHGINMRALTIAESPEFGIIRVVVDKPQEAMAVLKENHFVANMSDIVAVEVSDQPGGLAQILKVFSDNSINVEYMYGFIEKCTEKALLVFRFDDPDRAIAILMKNGINVVGKKDVGSL